MSKIISFTSNPIRFRSKGLLALELVLWLLWLPVVLRIHSIPMLLKGLASKNRSRKTSMRLSEVIEIVTHISSLRPFCSRFFPKLCLRQSLALYRTLCQMGYPVEIHFGARKNGEDLHGHSWVTLHGEPVADTARNEIFKVVYSYPYGGTEKERSKHEFSFDKP
jgi:Transglutaminase-like superfamily